jgi:threonine dehydrogenase-like Zn-dependent dehydrogenase
MRQAILVGRQKFEFRDVPVPAPGPKDVLVRVRASGICASELHDWEEGPKTPYAPGHEVAGDVVAVGPEVRLFKPGDRVTGLFHAGFADYACIGEDRVAPIPETIPTESAYGEPLACLLSAARRTKVDLGDRVAVVGLGFMGLMMMQLMRLKGAGAILGIDLRPEAARRGLEYGCDRTMTPVEFALAGDDPALQKFDVVVEATGTQDGLSLATSLTREHGVLSILGYHQGGPREIDMKLWNFRALEVLNAHERRPDYRMDCMRRGLALVAAGRLDLVNTTSHRFPLERVGDAFEALASKPQGFIKAVVVAGPEGA